MFITGVLIALFVILCVKWYRHRMNEFQVFKRLGIPGPEPSFFFGNAFEFEAKGMKATFHKWTEKYGEVYGYFEGTEPIVVFSNPEHIKQVAVKQFQAFRSHRLTVFDTTLEEEQDIFNSDGERWKRLRSVASLSFTARRMKEMSPLINKSVDDLMDLFDKRCEKAEPFDIHGDFGRLTMDVISSCAFGIDSGCIRDDSSKFLIECKKVFDSFEALPLHLRILAPIMYLFPNFIKRLRYIRAIDLFLTIQAPWLDAASRKVLRDRQSQEGQSDRVDFLQLMLDANKKLKKGEKLTGVEGDENDESYPTAENVPFNSKPLTETEMSAQIQLFLLAGYETTSTALGFTAHELAVNPDVQEKLRAEIHEYLPVESANPDYSTVNKLPYMEAVLKETLRFHPIAPIGTQRRCFEDTKVGDYRVLKGMGVHMNMDHLHFNPDLWGKHDPNKFVPERFLEDCQNVQQNMAWIPFGAGPRICLGMRFAQVEYKVTLVRLLKRFNIKRCSATKVPCPTKENGVHAPLEGVHVVLERRT